MPSESRRSRTPARLPWRSRLFQLFPPNCQFPDLCRSFDAFEVRTPGFHLVDPGEGSLRLSKTIENRFDVPTTPLVEVLSVPKVNCDRNRPSVVEHEKPVLVGT
ncbi:hypothetical protein [Aureimonas pseudogalii]|uniref:Uncharacterized protein n=1 Tax=Aureimonas pseudogalii TaxID=1744844 RepID=A0A7W6H934_9HYPH|nr:hypothetical protein [Aureimonas pseudogalii]MBB4000861.1 hypothetical protein [Aureimonas pseudogalii]